MRLTDSEIEGISAQALNMAKRDIQQVRFNFLMASYHAGDVPPLHRMTKVEAEIVSHLGEDWLNSGRAKDIGFYILRMAVDAMPPDAVVFCTAGNAFKPTSKLEAMPEAAVRELLDQGHDGQHQAVKEGLLILTDVLMAVTQTPERVCNYVQEFDGRHRPLGPPRATFLPQKCFYGRLKMFGKHYGDPEVNFTLKMPGKRTASDWGKCADRPVPDSTEE